MERLGLDTIKVGFVYNIVLCRKSVIGADRSWDRANGQDLPANTYFEYFDKTVAIHCLLVLEHSKLDNKLFEIWIDWDKYELHFTFYLSLASEIHSLCRV